MPELERFWLFHWMDFCVCGFVCALLTGLKRFGLLTTFVWSLFFFFFI